MTSIAQLTKAVREKKKDNNLVSLFSDSRAFNVHSCFFFVCVCVVVLICCFVVDKESAK